MFYLNALATLTPAGSTCWQAVSCAVEAMAISSDEALAGCRTWN